MGTSSTPKKSIKKHLPMTPFSDTFTQGGQTQIHKFHMIRQVVATTAKAGFWIFGITFLMFLWRAHTWQDFWFLLCTLKAHIRTEYFSFCPTGIFDDSLIFYRNGSTQMVSDYNLTHSDAYQNLKHFLGLSILRRLIYSVLISCVGVIGISWFWVTRGRQKQETKILGGFPYVEPKVLKKLILKGGIIEKGVLKKGTLKQRILKKLILCSKTSPYTIADVPIPRNAEFQHMMVTGTTGSGKSNMIHHLLQQIRFLGDQAIIVDTTGGIFSRFYDKTTDMLLNPLDQRSVNWNLWDEMGDEIGDGLSNTPILDEIAEAMIQDTRSLDSFWTQGARQLLVESIRYLHPKYDRSYTDLIDMTLTISLKELQRRLVGTPVSSMLDPAIDKTALSIRASLANSLRIIKDLPDTNRGEGISLLNFMKNDHKSWLFLSCTPDQRSFMKPLFSTWVSLVIKGLMMRPEGGGDKPHTSHSRTWIIIDELASLNRLPSLLMGLAEVRKYGGCFVLGFQDISQLEDLYGLSASKTLSNLTGTKVLFRAVDTDVAIRVSRYLGEQEKEEASESISFGAHQMRDGVSHGVTLGHQKQTRSVVTASQIMQLKDLEAYLKFPGDFPVTRVTFSYLAVESRVPGFVARAPIKPVVKSGTTSEEGSATASDKAAQSAHSEGNAQTSTETPLGASAETPAAKPEAPAHAGAVVLSFAVAPAGGAATKTAEPMVEQTIDA